MGHTNLQKDFTNHQTKSKKGKIVKTGSNSKKNCKHKMSKEVKLIPHIERLYLDPETADVNFVCESMSGQRERIPAHKALLIVASDVFKAMFSVSTMELQTYTITETSAEAFKEFLQFFYLYNAKLSYRHAITVMNLMTQYQVKEYSDVFEDWLKQKVTEDNVCWGFQLAILSKDEDMKEFCKDELNWNTEKAFKMSDFLACSSVELCSILQLDYFSCSESIVFERCIAWARVACERDGIELIEGKHLRQKLGDILYQIRYRSIKFDEFCTLLPTICGLFLAEELEEIFLLIAGKEIQPKFFNLKVRQMPIFSMDDNRVLHFSRLLDPTTEMAELIAANMPKIQTIETTTFSANKSLILGHFECIPVRSFQEAHVQPLTKITIIEKCELDSSDTENDSVPIFRIEADSKPVIPITNNFKPDNNGDGNVLFTGTMQLNENGTHFTLPVPIRIKPCFVYAINITLPTDSFEKLAAVSDVVLTIDNTNVTFYDQNGIVSTLYFNQL